jgi:hypothetical protein
MDLLGSKFNYGANMRLSEQLAQYSNSGDFGRGLEGYAERAKLLEDAIIEMAQDGWLMHGVEGMSDAQEKCYTAYLALTTNV